MKYIIPGAPIAWARPGSNGKIRYDTQAGIKKSVGMYLKFTHKDNGYYEGPLHFDIKFYLRHKKKTGHHNCRPDLDNMVKFYADVAMGILYHDDSQIAKITAEKVYSTENRTEITITELKNE